MKTEKNFYLVNQGDVTIDTDIFADINTDECVRVYASNEDEALQAAAEYDVGHLVVDNICDPVTSKPVIAVKARTMLGKAEILEAIKGFVSDKVVNLEAVIDDIIESARNGGGNTGELGSKYSADGRPHLVHVYE